MLARTCQNIGLEHHKFSERSKLSSPSSAISGPYNSYSNSLGEPNLFSMSQLTPPTVSSASKSHVNISTVHRLSPPAGFSSPMSTSTSTTTTTTTATFLPPSSPTVTNTKDHDLKSLSGDEADLQAHPSSDSLIQLARLSSSLKMSGDRQKRNKPLDSRLQMNYCRQQKRVRRQSFGRPSSGNASASKPIDFTVHPTAIASQRRSNTSTPSTPSSVSPSSLRSSPPAHSTSPFSIRNGTMLDLTSTAGTTGPVLPSSSASATSCLEMFYTVGNALGAPPERLRELLVTVAQALMDRSQSTKTHRPPATSCASAPASHGDVASPGLHFEGSECTRSSQPVCQSQPTQQLRSPQQPLNSFVGTGSSHNDPSTQCLYCGLVCVDMNSLVQHIYSHLASLHSQSSKPVGPQSLSQLQPLTGIHSPGMPAVVTPPMTIPLASSTSSASSPSSSYCSSTPSSISTSLPSMCNPIFEIAANYARYLQKMPSSLVEQPAAAPPPSELMVQTPSATAATDPNALFLAWLNIFRTNCVTEAMASATAHRFG
ncbi:unnamed protein product [Schistocephalus solidus]|uniref:C2H2-type domain-containing protein n=1 Tax=Schistocephalus solidus TaxID=70667 RepID=A0A183SUK7_SCHSO|nr:unnamed protein product [Schistocephalus solidus]